MGSIFFHKGYSEPSKRVRQTSAERSEAQSIPFFVKKLFMQKEEKSFAFLLKIMYNNYQIVIC